VARIRGGCCTGLAKPFLDPDFSKKRWLRIADDVEAYVAASDGNPIPGKEDAGDDLPEPLEHLLMYERYGELPRSGGLYEQPYYFMQDLEWARKGRQVYLNRKKINERIKSQFKDRNG